MHDVDAIVRYGHLCRRNAKPASRFTFMGRNLEVAGTYGAHVASFNETFCIFITGRNYNSIAHCLSHLIFSRTAQITVRTDSVIVNSK